MIDSDNIAMQINPENPRLADIEAGRKAIELFKFAIKNQIAFSMESTLSGNLIMQRMRKAKESGFSVQLNYVGVDGVEINLARVKARVKTGGHFIDEQIIHNRYDISLKNFLQVIPYCDDIFIYDNSGMQAELVFQITNGNIIQYTDNLRNWCVELLEELKLIGFLECV